VRVLSLNHGRLVQSELFGDVIRAAGHELVEWELPKQGVPPAGFDAVLVLGGHMNVGEEEDHPWLHDEYELLRGWIDSEMPLFGICLGAQTLAHATGARVRRLPAPHAGFSEVELTDEGTRDPVFGVLPPRFDAFFGNEYGFELPSGASPIATLDGAAQAYRLGERAWAVQFHPEARRDQVLAWWKHETNLPRPLSELADELDAKLPRWHELGTKICEAFLEAAARR
jgi:GMP synthase-like glutamine amidotransferase